jgi:hypothetical protein
MNLALEIQPEILFLDKNDGWSRPGERVRFA